MQQRIVSKPVASAKARSIAYVLHRNAMFSSLTVRPMVVDKDEAGIREFLKSISNGNFHANEVLNNANNPTSERDQYSFVVMAERQIIGVCILQLSEVAVH